MVSPYKDTFRGTAWYYARFRERYPKEFFTMISHQFALSQNDRILDLGCGTGQITIPISEFVKEVVAMDPEPEMVAEGKNQASKQGARNIVWVEGGSDDLFIIRNNLGRFRLVTMGTSFHWMDREKTLEELYEIIGSGGGIAIVGNTSIWTGLWADAPNELQLTVRAVITKWLGEERRAGTGIYTVHAKRHEQIVQESRYKRMEIWKHHWVASLTLDSIVGNLFSTSFANPNVLGSKKEAFEKDLRETLLTINPSGIFPSEGSLDAILAWK
jgi:ubiquinone/menaquinone biosynthesis C-methylase UbiE